MKRVIRRTKGEMRLRKELLSRLLRLGKQVLTGPGDTERQIHRKLDEYAIKRDPNYWSHSAHTRLLCTAAWLHPAGSALMYLHYRAVSVLRKNRGVSDLLEEWAERLMLSMHFVASETYSGRWAVVYKRLADLSDMPRPNDTIWALASALEIALPKEEVYPRPASYDVGSHKARWFDVLYVHVTVIDGKLTTAPTCALTTNRKGTFN